LRDSALVCKGGSSPQAYPVWGGRIVDLLGFVDEAAEAVAALDPG
jgi:hypothetical protein